MAKSMIHWNGNQVCVIDTETTGLDPHFHEMVQICILPLDSDLKPRKDGVLPFYIELIPEHPERADPKAMEINRLRLAEIARRGHDREKAKDLLEEWIKKLKLPLSKFGTPKRIMPLGQNYAFDMGFIKAWLGYDMYDEYFHPYYRDTMIASLYCNDKAGMHGENAPYPKHNLSYLCNRLNVEYENKHDALNDCVATAELYRRMCQKGLLA